MAPELAVAKERYVVEFKNDALKDLTKLADEISHGNKKEALKKAIKLALWIKEKEKEGGKIILELGNKKYLVEII